MGAAALCASTTLALAASSAPRTFDTTRKMIARPRKTAGTEMLAARHAPDVHGSSAGELLGVTELEPVTVADALVVNVA